MPLPAPVPEDQASLGFLIFTSMETILVGAAYNLLRLGPIKDGAS